MPKTKMSPSRIPRKAAHVRARVRSAINRHIARSAGIGAALADSWHDAVTKLIVLLAKLASLEAVHGREWKESMLRFYGRKLAALSENPPKGCEDRARELRTKYGKLFPQ